MNVAMSTKKIIDSTTCWIKNKSNCAIILSPITIANKKNSIIAMRNRTFAQLYLFLTQQCTSIYNLSLVVVTTHAPSC